MRETTHALDRLKEGKAREQMPEAQAAKAVAKQQAIAVVLSTGR
jgi:hypothetical protein